MFYHLPRLFDCIDFFYCTNQGDSISEYNFPSL